MVPFAVLVLGIASFPLMIPRAWGRHDFQILVTILCAAPVAYFLLSSGHGAHLRDAALSYASFVVTIGALYVTASGIYISGDIEAKPRTNLAFLFGGAAFAAPPPTPRARVLLSRPILSTTRPRSWRTVI